MFYWLIVLGSNVGGSIVTYPNLECTQVYVRCTMYIVHKQ